MRTEKTLVIIKPDGVQRSLIGDVIGRFERVGLKIVGMKMITADEERARAHYSLEDNWVQKVGEKRIGSYSEEEKKTQSNDPTEVGEGILSVLTRYITSGPVVAMVVEGPHAVAMVRKLVGGTEPLSSDVGTIRGDYVIDSFTLAGTEGRAVRNIAHASSSVEEANKEIDLWFEKSELCTYVLAQERLMEDINLDGHID